MGTELRRLKPETITRALLALRAELIRDGGDGLVHVEALLAIRGCNMSPVPRKATVHFRRNRLRLAIHTALKGGPLTGREIVERLVEAHGLAYGALYRSVYAQLWQMKKVGMLEYNGRVWGPVG